MSSNITNRALAAIFLVGLLLQPLCAGDRPAEYEVKAAFIYQFTKFVEWPSNAFADSSSPIVIGVLGDDPFGRYLDDAVRGKDAGGRKLVVKRFSKLADTQYCHILYVCSSEKKRLSSILSKFQGRSTLTISDINSFAVSGGVIELKTKGGKVCFEINVSTAKQADLKVSSKLLRLASHVYD